MKQKKMLSAILGLLFLANQVVIAAEKGGLRVYTRSENPLFISFNDFKKITFGNSGILFWDSKGVEEISYNDFSKIIIDDTYTPSDIGNLHSPQKDISIQYNKDDVTIISSRLMQQVALYDLNGRVIMSIQSSSKSYNFSVSDFPKGIYILKVFDTTNNVSYKIRK